MNRLLVKAAAQSGVLFALLGTAAAEAPEGKPLFIELPPDALPYDLGAGGFVVVGTFFNGGGFYWMPTSGVVPIGGRYGEAVSRDGKTIVGRALDSQGREHAAIWTGGKEWRLLGSFAPDAQSCDAFLSGTWDVSDDGRVILGLGWNGCNHAHAFRWEEATGVVDLGSSVAGQSSRANGVSGNGRIVVGWQEDSVGFWQGAKWVDGVQQILMGPKGPTGEARATNSDGSIIVGGPCSGYDRSAFVWTAATGVRCYPVERRVATKPYLALMFATSEDGRVIGGAHSFGLDSEAVVWFDGAPQFLEQYLRENGVPDAFRGWINTGFILAVSLDGRVLAGYGAGPRTFQGYVVILPELGPRP